MNMNYLPQDGIGLFLELMPSYNDITKLVIKVVT